MARGKKRESAKVKKVAAKPSAVQADIKEPAVKDLKWRARFSGTKARRASKERSKILLPDRSPVSGAPTIFMRSMRVLINDWQLFSVVLLVYALLHLLLVGGLTGGSGALATARSTFSHSGPHTTLASQGVTLFSTLVGSSSSSQAGGVYESFLFLIMSVVLIWALRQVYAKNVIRARDAFYQGSYPLIPFILILLVIGVELLPLVFGVGLYTYLVGGGIAVGPLEYVVVLALFFACLAGSVYMLCSSAMALYIVTLPDMTPMKALKEARELVHFRRWIVLRKLLFIPVLLLAVAALILIPIALYIPPIALFVLLILSVLGFAVVHSYMYALYRELL